MPRQESPSRTCEFFDDDNSKDMARRVAAMSHIVDKRSNDDGDGDQSRSFKLRRVGFKGCAEYENEKKCAC